MPSTRTIAPTLLRRDVLDAAAAGDTTTLEAKAEGWRALARVILRPQADVIVTGPGTSAFGRFVDVDPVDSAW